MKLGEDPRWATPRGAWLSNIYDPARPDANRCLLLSSEDPLKPEGRALAWAHHMEWVAANMIGPPMPSTTYTVDQLVSMGMVGVYAKVRRP